MIPFLPMMIGGGLGLLANRKDPLKGALLGAGLGAAGGMIAPQLGGLLGNPMTAASYGTGLGTQQTAMLAAQEAGMGSMPISGSLMGNANSALSAAKPFADAASIGMQFAGQPEQAPPPPQLMPQQGAQTLAQLANQTPPQTAEEADRLMRRRQRRGLM